MWLKAMIVAVGHNNGVARKTDGQIPAHPGDQSARPVAVVVVDDVFAARSAKLVSTTISPTRMWVGCGNS